MRNSDLKLNVLIYFINRHFKHYLNIIRFITRSSSHLRRVGSNDFIKLSNDNMTEKFLMGFFLSYDRLPVIKISKS